MQCDIGIEKTQNITSVCDGYEAFVLSALLNKNKPLLYMAGDGVNLAQTSSMLRFLHPKLKILEFPAWDTVPYDRVSPNSTIMAKRVETLSYLAFYDGREPLAVITSIGALMQKLPPQKVFKNARKKIKVGGKLDFNDFLHYVSMNGYTRVEQVMEPGEYALRGDITDIFPSGTENPLRIDLFDDEIERLRVLMP